MRKITLFILAAVFLTACGSTSAESPLIVSTASSLTEVMGKVETEFQKTHPDIELAFNYGSSSKLRSQLQQGAPADIFLSASEKDMEILTDELLVMEETVSPFAKNQLVLASSEHLDKTEGFAQSLLETKGPIAVGEPESVPLGGYTKQALNGLGLWKKLEGKMIFAKDARQVLTYLESGNAELGIIYSSDAQTSEKVSVIGEVPGELEPVVYPAGIVGTTEKRKAAEAFLEFLTGAGGREILEQYGFIPMDGEAP